ncbi:DUF4870 domain-containing protein [Actinoplanes sp. TFC3]|uniref:DUF4870 domain-containing protein n=1 Tax=Actinoplanes sp. TFC3 TaxID=1710355 RepID=UPI000835E8A7|nr:DUF4870 domain-containing protein [Actinoplanes sp. TFC3]
MTEPPRPPGEGQPSDPTEPFNQYPPPPYNPPPASGAGGYPPPSSGSGGYPPPAGGFPPPPPSSGAPYGQQPPPSSGGPYGQPYGASQYNPQGGGGSNEDRTWILVAHFGGAAGAFITGGVAGWIAPLVAMLARGNQSPLVRSEAVKALNFQLLWAIIAIVGYILTCIVVGFVVAIAAWLIASIIGVIAGVKAANNEPYKYPMTVSLIK